MSIDIDIRGVTLLEAKIVDMEQKADSGFISLLIDIIQRASEYAANNTHVITGTLKASHYADIAAGGPGAVDLRVKLRPLRNPRNKMLSTEYAGKEHGRGGGHAFYDITFNQFLQPIVKLEVKKLFD